MAGFLAGWFFAVLALLVPRAKRLDEFVALGQFFWSDDLAYEPVAVQKHLLVAGMSEHLQALDAALEELAALGG